jgi:hypothetical protein
MSKDKCCIPEDIFAIVGKYLHNDCKSLMNLVKTKKSLKDIIGSEVNLEEKKQNYIDVCNCFKLFNYIKKISTYNFKIKLLGYDLNMESVSCNNSYSNFGCKDKIRLYENKKTKNLQKVEKITEFVKNNRCIRYIEEYIRNSYYEATYNHMSYVYNRISLISSQKLYHIILKIDDNYIFSHEDSHILNWILEINDYDSEADTYNYQDYSN